MPTPPHIVPEWYFLPIHAIIHIIPDKAGGVAAIAPVFISLLALPFLKKCICLVQVFNRFTMEYFGCFWRIANYYVGSDVNLWRHHLLLLDKFLLSFFSLSLP
uniref:Uncharacterized protein n=1 Tax=Avena sativa TaxID=4498 RepID=A0ACD5U6W0_AVESA